MELEIKIKFLSKLIKWYWLNLQSILENKTSLLLDSIRSKLQPYTYYSYYYIILIKIEINKIIKLLNQLLFFNRPYCFFYIFYIVFLNSHFWIFLFEYVLYTKKFVQFVIRIENSLSTLNNWLNKQQNNKKKQWRRNLYKIQRAKTTREMQLIILPFSKRLW